MARRESWLSTGANWRTPEKSLARPTPTRARPTLASNVSLLRLRKLYYELFSNPAVNVTGNENSEGNTGQPFALVDSEEAIFFKRT
jgi:hypothetical protein